MSADIGPGDFVECVDIAPMDGGGPPPLNLGAVYCVRGRGRIPDHRPNCPGAPTVYIDGPRDALGDGFLVRRFRPILRPKPDAFTDLLKVPDRKRVTA